MKLSAYTRPKKPDYIQVTRRADKTVTPLAALPEPVIVDSATECHVTPADVAARMVEYLTPARFGYTLEPSAGTGALVRAAMDAGHTVQAVERHCALAAILGQILPSQRVENACFLEWSAGLIAEARAEQKEPPLYSRIVMNPPFKKVAQHIAAALSLLDYSGAGGRLVALVPITFQHPQAETLEVLPDNTFALAKVNTKIILIEKVQP